MTINLTTEAPTDDAESLTDGGKYSLFHRGGITAAVLIDGEWTVVYSNRSNGNTLILGLPGTAIRLALADGSAAAAIVVTELA